MPLACRNRAVLQLIAPLDRRSIVELEFGDAYRHARFPSGWYILPSVGLGMFSVALVVLLF
jgi:hypothetical protein